MGLKKVIYDSGFQKERQSAYLLTPAREHLAMP